MNTKLALAIAVASVIVAITVAPSVTNQAFARSLTTCNQDTGPCPGNSGSNGNDNKCQTTYTGNSVNSKVKSGSC